MEVVEEEGRIEGGADALLQNQKDKEEIGSENGK